MLVGGNFRIGVLGGIGPESTKEFYERLIENLQKSGLIKNNTDFPQIVINSIPAPELIYDKISARDLQPYIKGLKELDEFGVDFIVMVCNTIHLYFEKLQNGISTPILDLREEIRKVLNRRKIKSALILGTPSTVKQGLYRFEGVRTFEPSLGETKFLSRSIFNFNRGRYFQKERVGRICQKYLKKGAEIVILGCTEFSVMLRKDKFVKLNTIDILVDATMSRLTDGLQKFIN